MDIKITDLPEGPYKHFAGCPESEGPFGVLVYDDHAVVFTAAEVLGAPALGTFGFLPYARQPDGSYIRPDNFDGFLQDPLEVRKLIPPMN